MYQVLVRAVGDLDGVLGFEVTLFPYSPFPHHSFEDR